MAVIEELKKKDEEIPDASAPQQIATAVGPSAEASQQPAPTQDTLSSRRFGELQKFVTSNAPANYTSKIASTIQKQSDRTKNEIASTQSRLNEQVNPELQRLRGGEQFITNTVANAGNNLSQADIDAYARLRTGDYRKDYTPENFGTLQSQTQDVRNLAEGVYSEPGRIKLLQQTFGPAGGYTAQQARLDQLLLQQRPDLLASLQPTLRTSAQNVETAYSGLKSGKQAAEQEIGQLGQAGQQQAVFKATDALNTIKKSLSDTSKAKLDEVMKMYNTGKQYLGDISIPSKLLISQLKVPSAQQADFTAAWNVLSNPFLNRQAELTGSSTTGQTIDPLRNITVNQALTDEINAGKFKSPLDVTPWYQLKDTSDINAQNFATQEQLARSQGLAKLLDESSYLNAVGKYSSGVLDPYNYASLDAPNIIQKIKSEYAPKYANIQEADTAQQAALKQKWYDTTAGRVGLGLTTGGLSEVARFIAPVTNRIVGGASSAARSVGNFFSRIFCFAPDTKILMADGSKKMIKDIKLGDKVYGGYVYAIAKALPKDGDVFDYQGTIVSGSHPVFEDGNWVRVNKSKKAKLHNDPSLKELYTLSTSDHRIMANGNLFSDYDETEGQDNFETGKGKELIKELNKDTPKDNARLNALNKMAE